VFTKSGTYTTPLRISETVKWENVREIGTNVFCDDCLFFQPMAGAGASQTAKILKKILAAMCVQWSSDLLDQIWYIYPNW